MVARKYLILKTKASVENEKKREIDDGERVRVRDNETSISSPILVNIDSRRSPDEIIMKIKYKLIKERQYW
jgi:hypothetical protein